MSYNELQGSLPNNFSIRKKYIGNILSNYYVSPASMNNPEGDIINNIIPVTKHDLQVPLTKVDHIGLSQNYQVGGITFTPQQLTAPIISTSVFGLNSIYILPDAPVLLNAYGGSSLIQNGDFIIIKILSLGVGGTVILPGVNGTSLNSKQLNAYSATNCYYNILIIQFTDVSIGSEAYTIY
jgi:hypothetical protein